MKITSLIFITMFFALFGCNSQPKQIEKSINSLGEFPYNSNIDELTVVEIDGCQYIVCNAYGNHDITITHKGNCKFCVMRKENEFFAVYDEE
jgi:hypothetical protein